VAEFALGVLSRHAERVRHHFVTPDNAQ
jgi:hypothetical protein